MNIWGHEPVRYDARPHPTDPAFPMPVPPRSPVPFYAPGGPGPIAPGVAVSMPAVPPHHSEHRHHEKHHRHKHRDRSPQVLLRREARPVIPVVPQVVNQTHPKSNLVNPGFMNPNLLMPGQHHSTHSHTRHKEYKHSRSHSREHKHDHRHEPRHQPRHEPRHEPRHDRRPRHDESHHQSHNQGQGHDRHRDHSRGRSHSHGPRPRRDSSSRRPTFLTTGPHVQPFPIPSPVPSEQQQHRGRQSAPKMPPSTPVHLRTHSLPDKPNSLPVFQYSRCTGRKKALCIGINYTGKANELRGCVNDVKTMRNFLIKYWGYKSGDMVVLTDDATNPRQLPTKRNIMDAMRWLVRDAQCNDALLFHYSGHGGQTRDLNGDEIDGFDEVIFPLDYATAGYIIDDDMHSIMVKPLPQGCRLTAVFDSCHSGTALDLPYIYHSDGRLRGNQISSRALASKSTPADVISWCACRDDQTSADTTEAGVAVGAMSWAFMLSLKQNPNQTYAQLLRSVRELLRKRYSQKSQLSSSHPIDTNIRFLM